MPAPNHWSRRVKKNCPSGDGPSKYSNRNITLRWPLCMLPNWTPLSTETWCATGTDVRPSLSARVRHGAGGPFVHDCPVHIREKRLDVLSPFRGLIIENERVLPH